MTAPPALTAMSTDVSVAARGMDVERSASIAAFNKGGRR